MTSDGTARVLVVEDDPAMALALRDGFEFEGHEVVVAADGESGLQLARNTRFDVIILDVMLPKQSGLEICRALRAARDEVPILMLSARGQESDKVQGLDLGADDYVTKPFGFAELSARVQALLRRARRAERPDVATFGDVALDFRTLRATRGDAPLDLSAREFAILGCLLAQRGEVVSRESLLRNAWGYDTAPFTRTVDMHIAKLRRKIEPDPAAPTFIVTVPRAGYRFEG